MFKTKTFKSLLISTICIILCFNGLAQPFQSEKGFTFEEPKDSMQVIETLVNGVSSEWDKAVQLNARINQLQNEILKLQKGFKSIFDNLNRADTLLVDFAGRNYAELTDSIFIDSYNGKYEFVVASESGIDTLNTTINNSMLTVAGRECKVRPYNNNAFNLIGYFDIPVLFFRISENEYQTVFTEKRAKFVKND